MTAYIDADAMKRPIPVVSCDGHAGPRLVEELRPYCPKAYLERFDAYVAQQTAPATGPVRVSNLLADSADLAPEAKRMMAKFANMMKTKGHHDFGARLADMDRDGVTAEVIFPTSHNQQSEPFIQSDLFLDPTKGDTDLFSVGMHIYASWLADACKLAPGRFIGMVTPPLWDIEASVREVEWAAKAGLKGVFLLMPRPGILRYDNRAWEPFWAACEDLGMTLNTHSGAPLEEGIDGPHGLSMHAIETGGWPARKACHQLIYGGVFERHPKLKIIFTEQNFDWWVSSSREFDSNYRTHGHTLRHVIPKKPSEYMATNVFIGASFMAPFEAEDAVRNGYVDHVVWGRDYGHVEGTFQPTEDDDPETNPTRLSMRYALANIDPPAVRKMVSDNGIDFYSLDRAELTATAERIGSPSLAELGRPIQSIPENGGVLSFRQIGAWG